MEDKLVGKVVLSVAGDGLDEFTNTKIGTTSCGSDKGFWTVSEATLVDVAGTIASPRAVKGKTILSKTTWHETKYLEVVGSKNL